MNTKIKKGMLLVVITLMSVITVHGQRQESIKAMSFNVRYDNPKDGIQNWHNRKENIVRMIHFYDTDIMGLQEVLVHQLKYLEDNLEQYNYVGVGREDGKEKGEFAPIFYRKARFKLLNSGTFWLSETPEKVSKGWDAGLERIVTWAVFEEKASGKEFIFMNTHFDHVGVQARIESSKLLKRKAIELAGDMQMILSGDFNLVPHSEGIQTLLREDGARTIVDSKSIAKYSYGPDWTTCGFDNRPFEKRRIIDYVFVKGIDKVHRYAVLAEMLNELFLSDHCPVFVELEL